MTSRSPIFRGVGVALVTLFDESGTVAIQPTIDHAVNLVGRGVQAVLLAGTTGEFWALTLEDRARLIAAARDALPAEIPVIAGTGADSSEAAAALTRSARSAGADAVLVLPPKGAKDLRSYYGQVSEAAAGLPVIGYHFPLVSPPGLPVSLLADLSLQAVKDSGADPRRLLEQLDRFDGDVYVGADSLLCFAGPVGCAGALVALANLEPELCIEAFKGDAKAQRRLAPIERESVKQFPIGLKALLHERSGASTALGRSTPAIGM